MSPVVKEIAQPPPPRAAALVFDAVLRPNRSLSRTAFRLVFGAFAFANAVMALFFLAQGAYPVSGFLGLDVLAFFIAFKISNRDGRAFERVAVDAECVHVEAAPARGPSRHFVVSPAWARVHEDERVVRLSAGGKSLRLGGFLSPEEREAFAAALRAALATARDGRIVS